MDKKVYRRIRDLEKESKNTLEDKIHLLNLKTRIFANLDNSEIDSIKADWVNATTVPKLKAVLLRLFKL